MVKMVSEMCVLIVLSQRFQQHTSLESAMNDLSYETLHSFDRYSATIRPIGASFGNVGVLVSISLYYLWFGLFDHL